MIRSHEQPWEEFRATEYENDCPEQGYYFYQKMQNILFLPKNAKYIIFTKKCKIYYFYQKMSKCIIFTKIKTKFIILPKKPKKSQINNERLA